MGFGVYRFTLGGASAGFLELYSEFGFVVATDGVESSDVGGVVLGGGGFISTDVEDCCCSNCPTFGATVGAKAGGANWPFKWLSAETLYNLETIVAEAWFAANKPCNKPRITTILRRANGLPSINMIIAEQN